MGENRQQGWLEIHLQPHERSAKKFVFFFSPGRVQTGVSNASKMCLSDRRLVELVASQGPRFRAGGVPLAFVEHPTLCISGPDKFYQEVKSGSRRIIPSSLKRDPHLCFQMTENWTFDEVVLGQSATRS